MNVELSFYLKNSAVAKLTVQEPDNLNFPAFIQNLSQNLQADRFTISSGIEQAVLTIINPRENVIGFLVDKV